MEQSKTLLEKIDFFQILFMTHLLGLIIQPHLEMVIPLYHPLQIDAMAGIIACAWLSYLCGKFLARSKRKISQTSFPERSSSRIVPSVLLILILLQFSAVMVRYFIKGFPILSSTPAIAKSFFLEEPTYGCTRILYVLLPLSVSVYFADVLQKRNIKYLQLASIFSLILIPLICGLFKGAVVTFLGGLIIIYDKFYAPIRIRLTFSNVILGCLIIVFPLLQYYFSEGENDFYISISYILQRLCIYSLEGFNYIVYASLDSNFIQQLRECIGIDPFLYPPGYILSQEMVSRDNPNFATVTTLYGYCWRNGGWACVCIAFFSLGWIVQLLVEKIRISNHPFFVPIYINLYIILIKMLLVGEPFNDLRGPILSLLFAIFVYYSLRNHDQKGNLPT